MTIVVGLPRDERARTALALAAMLARSVGEDLVVCTVVPAPWPPGLAKVDAEYQDYVDRAAAEALDEARATLPPDIPATFVVSRARSTAAGLLEVVDAHGADLLVLGSSSASVLGRVAFGSVADRLLHSAHVPVALAPRGYRCGPGIAVTRVTVAFGATEGSADLVVAAARMAVRAGAALRIASFAVRPRTPLQAGVGSRAEAAVVQEWVADIEHAQRGALEQVAQLPVVPRDVEAVVGHGRDWDAALEDVEWTSGDVLVVGSSAEGPLARVFLGSRSSKIVRHSPVPVLVVPRSTLTELSERADQPP